MQITTKFLLYVYTNEKLGLRAGENPENAAYSMLDFTDLGPIDLLAWMREPEKEGPNKERTDKWLEHLYNSIWKINDLTHSPFNLILVSDAIGSGERYNAPGGRGDKKTFQKCNKLPITSKKVAERLFQVDQVETAYNWALDEIDRLSNKKVQKGSEVQRNRKQR
jgi:hypothetical protein